VLDVAIVGAGPVGSVAANLCGVFGLSAAAFDREADVYDLPRAAGLYDDAQRILHNAGVLDAVLPGTGVMAGAEFVDASGRRIVGFEIPPGLRTLHGYPPLLNIAQPVVERAIRACLPRHPGVALHVSHEVVNLRQSDDHVELVVHDRAADTRRRVQARWLIGCDGATSLVRKSCDIGWSSLGYDCDWLVTDLELTRDVPLPRLCQQVCDPERPTTVIPLPGRLRRWEFQLRPGETRPEMEDRERVWALLAPWLSPADGQILRAVVYRFHATIAETFRQGRIFLAGDAAHQTPPFLGQGLCTGLRDAENLVWKLAAVRRGRAGDSLLDTYTAERRPLAVAMVEHSTKTGQLIDAYAAMARGGPPPPPELQAYAYGGGSRLPDLAAGLLALEGGDWVGRHVPHALVPTSHGERPLDDVVGPRWAVVARDDPRSRVSAETRHVWDDLEAAVVPVPEPAGAMQALLAAHDVVIVRPDRIVYGVASMADADALAARLHRHLAAGRVATEAGPPEAPDAAILQAAPDPMPGAKER
jgi:3-(3-hydroxy-phenyl)propionate hydroxylase